VSGCVVWALLKVKQVTLQLGQKLLVAFNSSKRQLTDGARPKPAILVAANLSQGQLLKVISPSCSHCCELLILGTAFRHVHVLGIEAGNRSLWCAAMSSIRKITTEVSKADLVLAQQRCGRTITEAVRQGRERLAADRRRDIMLSLRGKVTFCDSWQTLRGKDDEE
jgi:hypothetical protein